MGHRDAHPFVGGDEGLGGEAVALGAEHQGHTVHLVRGHLVEALRLLVGGEREQAEARLAHRLQGLGPGFEACVGDREDGAHGDLHRAAVERVGAVRGEQDRVHAERGRAAEDGADVRVVVHRFHDDDAALRGEDFVGGRERLALHRGEGAAVHVVAGDALGEVRAHGVDRGRDLVDDVAHDVDPLGGEQHGAHLVPGLLGPSDHLLALGDEEALGGLAPAAEFDVGQARVVAQARVVGIFDGDETLSFSHRLILPCPGCGANGSERVLLPLVTCGGS